MRRLWRYLAPYRARYGFGALCLLMTASLAMAIPALLRAAVDAIPQMLRGEPSHVDLLVLGIVGIAIAQAITRTFSRFVIFNVGRDVEYDLRNDLFRHLERLPLAYYQCHPTGDLMSRLVNDISAVRMMLGPGILNLANTPIYYVYALSIMLSIDPLLTLGALSPYPFALFSVKRFSRRLMEGQLRVQEGLAEMSGLIQESVSGIHVVKAYVREGWSRQRFAHLNASFRDASLELGRVRGLLPPVTRSVSALGTLVVLWLGGSRVAEGLLTIGDLVAFIGYLHLLAWPTMALGWMLSILQRGRVAMARLEEIFVVEPSVADPIPAESAAEQRPAEPGSPGAIVLRGVSFAYPGSPDRLVLRDIDLSVPPGATVALVGRAGSGKTTLLQLLPRLFDPSSGAVYLGGRDLRELPLAELRRSIAFVPQDPFLFSTSIRANLAFAEPGLVRDGEGGERRIREAAEWAAVAGDIEDFPRGYDTMIGERGVTLSGGQKQRVTLARALLVDTPILILDDSLSSVDTQTEERILAALERRRRGRTCFLVAHRLSTVQDADLIVVLDEGRIVERGDHQSLLAQNGLYAELFRRQRLSAELEAI